MARVTIEVDQWLADYLKLWKDTGEAAPANELQSIQAWLRMSGSRTKEQMQDVMRKRMILLMDAANAVYDAGPAIEDEFGIFENRSREEMKK